MVAPGTMLAIKKSAAARPVFFAWMLIAILFVGCRPSGPRLLLEGERLIREGRYAEATQKLTEATKLLPAHAQAWNHLGLSYHGAGQAALAALVVHTGLSPGRHPSAARYQRR